VEGARKNAVKPTLGLITKEEEVNNITIFVGIKKQVLRHWHKI